jgi:hypothetical protein
MVKLSPPTFYVEIICNFDITCKSSRRNLISVKIFNFALVFLEYAENHRFLAIIRRKNYLLEKIFEKKVLRFFRK